MNLRCSMFRILDLLFTFASFFISGKRKEVIPMEEPGLTITRFYRYGEEVDDITQDLYDHMDYSRSLGFAYTQRLIDDPHYLHQKLQDALEYVCGDYASFSLLTIDGYMHGTGTIHTCMGNIDVKWEMQTDA